MYRLLRIALLLTVLVVRPGLYAQKDTGLTRTFDGLSAKERSRIAKQEEEGSMKDAQYQAVMTQAEGLFRDQRYDEALLEYIKARELRPYNVYPKVKIQDLQALIARRDAAAAPTVAVTQVPDVVPEPVPLIDQPSPPLPVVVDIPPVDPRPVDHMPPAAAVEGSGNVPERTVERPPPSERPRTHTPTSAERVTVPAPPLSDGTKESVYKEANAVVRERRVVREGKETIYRQVTHPYGATVYFKDGIPVTERIWQASNTE